MAGEIPTCGVTARAPTRQAGAQLRVRLLGGFGLWAGSEAVRLTPKAQRLVAHLALHELGVDRGLAAAVLWPEATQTRACGNLRSVLWRVQHAAHVIQASDGGLRLAEPVHVDVREATVRARAAVDGSHPLDELTGADIELLSQDLLPGWCEEWVLVERERIRQLRMHALERLADALRKAGRFAEALDAALAAVAAEPLRESAQATLITIHLAEGNLVEARRQYESYALLLRAELSCEPSSDLRRRLV